MPDSEQPREIGRSAREQSADGGAPALPFYQIFIGPDGLRAGWALLLFAVIQQCLRYLIFPVVQWLFSPSLSPGQPMHVASVACYEGAALLCVLLATSAVARIEHHRARDYGLQARRGATRFVAGFAWGLGLLTLLMLWLRWQGLLVLAGRQLSGWTAWAYGIVWLVAFLLVGIFEEYSFRGYVQFALWRGIRGSSRRLGMPRANTVGFWVAALLTSCFFASVHLSNTGESPIGLIAAGLIGMVFCLSLWRTGSLWWAIGFHTAWDWAQSFLYGVGDSGSTIWGHWLISYPVGSAIRSGGTTGPEGSIFVLPVIGLATCGALLLRPDNENTGVYDTATVDFDERAN